MRIFCMLLCLLAAHPLMAQIIEESAKPSRQVYAFADEMPTYPGGYEKYMAENVKYPAHALENNIQGVVYIQIIIDETGKVTEPKILKAADTSLAKEALRVIAKMPNWVPGKQNGNAVAVKMTIPVKFTLIADDPKKKTE